MSDCLGGRQRKTSAGKSGGSKRKYVAENEVDTNATVTQIPAPADEFSLLIIAVIIVAITKLFLLIIIINAMSDCASHGRVGHSE